MKQKDIALLIVVIAISGVASFIVSNYVFGSPADHAQKVATVDAITTDFPTPDAKFFNSNAIDPAKLIEVGTSNNSNPFSGSGH